jgi:hypothetical protein
LVEQGAPCVQATQAPAEVHTLPWPQLWPGARAVAVSAQPAEPALQVVMPCTQGFGLVEHAWPAVHAMHVPVPLQMSPEPQLVPGAAGVVESMHTGPPVAQEMAPCQHTLGLPVQVASAVHGTQTPAPVQTWAAPQLVPAGVFAVPSLHTGPDAVHALTPLLQGVGFVAQGRLAVHATQPPSPSQTPAEHVVSPG